MLNTRYTGPAGTNPLWKLIVFPVVELAMFVLAVLTAQIGLSGILHLLAGDGQEGIVLSLINALPLILSPVAGVAVTFLFIRRQSWRESPFGFQRWLTDLALGFLAGILIITAVVLVLAVTGLYQLNGIAAFDDGQLVSFLVSNLLFFLGVSVMEEALFRAGMFHLFEAWWGSGVALILSAVTFGLIHLNNPHATVIGAVAIILEAGILLGAVYMLTRRLWMVIGIHWSWNFFQGPVYGSVISGISETQPSVLSVTISGPAWLTGGSFGFEASVIAIILATGAGIIVLRGAVLKGTWLPFPNRWKPENKQDEKE